MQVNDEKITKFKGIAPVELKSGETKTIQSHYKSKSLFNFFISWPTASQGRVKHSIDSVEMPNDYREVAWGRYTYFYFWLEDYSLLVLGNKSSEETLKNLGSSPLLHTQAIPAMTG